MNDFIVTYLSVFRAEDFPELLPSLRNRQLSKRSKHEVRFTILRPGYFMQNAGFGRCSKVGLTVTLSIG